MNSILTHAHSGLRWVAILLLLWAIVNAFTAKTFEKKHKMVNLFTMITLHTQLIIGFIQYFFTSTKTNFDSGWIKIDLYRFYGMEHLLGMLIAIVLITMGYSKSKRGVTDMEKFKPIKLFYLIGFILILASIPWPFRTALGGSWF